jgi:putative nucleotidyltransferase with HDIG domain
MQTAFRRVLHNLSALAELAAEISSTHEFEQVIRTALHTLLGALAVPRGAIARASLRPLQLKIIAEKGSPGAKGMRLALAPEEADLLARAARPLKLPAKGEALERFLERNGGALSRLGARIASPLVARGQLMGIIFLSEKFNREAFSEDDLQIIGAISRHIAMALQNRSLLVSLKRKAEENQRLYRQVHQLFQDIVRAFAAAIDLKDPYTRGHSERVARYSEAIAREMGISGPQLEYISVAGYLHDIGKILVDRSIINNPLPLSEPEHMTLRSHVTAGYEILSAISDPWKQIAYMTKCHHERFDGSGYPQGLSGDQIPLGSRIVTLADSFDAMITNRAYRRRLPLERALEEIKLNAGRQFDPKVVAAFSRALAREVNGQTKERILTMALDGDFDRQAVTELLNSMIEMS